MSSLRRHVGFKIDTKVSPEDANLQCLPVEKMITGVVADRVPVLYQH